MSAARTIVNWFRPLAPVVGRDGEEIVLGQTEAKANERWRVEVRVPIMAETGLVKGSLS